MSLSRFNARYLFSHVYVSICGARSTPTRVERSKFEGETEADNGKRYPPLGRTAIEKTADGFTYLNIGRYRADFAADLPVAEAAFEARAQMLTSAAVFTTPITNPAWKLKPSWYLVAGSDRIISPDLERMYASRAHSQTVEVAGASHSVYRSRPKEIAALIEKTARRSGE